MNEQNVDVKEGNDLECPICLLLLREAMGTHCRHLLCKVCLEKLQRSSNDNGRDLICPTCKEKIDVNQEHHKKCYYVIVSCDNNGCGDKLARNVMKQHAVKCPHRLVNCMHCQMKVEFIQLNEHHYTECHKILVDCAMDCGVQMPREKMEKHLDEVCGLVEVECQFSNAGCNSKIQRMDAQKHNVEFTQIHMCFLLDKLNQSQRKIEQLEKTNTQSKRKIEQLEIANDQSQKKINCLVNEGQDLATLLHKGVRKWIDKKQIPMLLTYQEWYKMVDEKMGRNSVHKYNDFMFVKVVKNRRHSAIKWRFDNFAFIFSLPEDLIFSDKIFRVSGSGPCLDVLSTEFVSSGISDCFICHPNDGMKQMNYITHRCCCSYNVGLSMALFDDFILCVSNKK